MTPLFPPIDPFNEFHLGVSHGHQIYVEQCGNPNGQPVIFVHGGPGGGCGADDRRFFNPEHYHIILFDQRSCGRSLPHGELDNLDTQYLIEDMEAIRQHLNIDNWHVFGGSWGSTLSLVYAQAHPDKVKSLVLRGIFLARPQDCEWIFEGGGGTKIFYDYWQKFLSSMPFPAEEFSMQRAYDVLTGDDKAQAAKVARAWTEWEINCCFLEPKGNAHEESDESCWTHARHEAHYILNQFFLSENHILNHCDKIQDIPTTIVHGRYDVVCALENAYLLHQKLPKSEFVVSKLAGHASREVETAHHLVNATEKMRQL